MQLHSLTLQAIGPFDGRHRIDFAELGKSGLFLLEGPTGAGKSTIIDAVVFALYGSIAGADASKQRLHSHHAAAGVEPFVDLVFEVQSGIFRVRRTPAHERPKKSGTGTTTQNEQVKLIRLASADFPDVGEALSTSAPEVNGEIKRVVGLDSKQFLQTVVLPQGEFAKFLRSRGEERKDLLRTIFRTDIYEEMTEQLKSSRNAANRSIESSKKSVGQSLASFGTACQSPLVDALDPDDFDAIEVACTQLAATVETEATAAARADAAARTALKAATEHRMEQQRLATLLATRTDLLARKTAHAAQHGVIEALRASQQDAQRARNVSLTLAGLAKAGQAVAEATGRMQEAQQQLTEVMGAAPQLDDLAGLADLAELRDAILARSTNLTSLHAVESGLLARRTALQGQAKRRQHIEARITKLTQRTAAAPAAIAAIEVRHKAAAAAAHESPVADKAVGAAEAVLTAATNALAGSTELAALTRDCDRLVAAGREAATEVATMHQRRLDQYAGVLSSKLVAGQPCAVCGSIEHPAPAALDLDHVTDDDIGAAEAALAVANAAAKSASVKVSDCQQRLILEQERAGGHNVVSATDALMEARARLDATLTAVTELAVLDDALAAARSRHEADKVALSAARVEAATLRADELSQESALHDDEHLIATTIDGAATSLTALMADLDRQRQAITHTIAAHDTLQHARQSRDNRQIEVDQALKDNAFDNAGSALAAVVPPAELKAIDNRLSVYDNEAAIIANGLAHPDIAALSGDERTDIDAAIAAENHCQQGGSEAQKLANVLADRDANTARCLTALQAAIGRHRSAHSGASTVIRLAGIAEGTHVSNLRRISFGTYVLMRRFDDVVTAANARYGPMSNGRYRLIRIDEKEGKGGGQRTGLALAVLDGVTGTQREPRTLSGGETFNASLCLALGLADVVTGETGGIELGTLFVDEGFGTLDSESLDRVMVELGKLSAGGRIVGIVSHVEDLKQRVADRIEVRRKPDGSSTLRVKGG